MTNRRFRGKRMGGKIWHYGYFYKDKGKCYIKEKGRAIRVDCDTVGQCTGMRDMVNRKEIYEGDIILLPNGDICLVEYKVYRDQAMFTARPLWNKEKDKTWSEIPYYYFNGKIIGNKYDNPELLKRRRRIRQ